MLVLCTPSFQFKCCVDASDWQRLTVREQTEKVNFQCLPSSGEVLTQKVGSSLNRERNFKVCWNPQNNNRWLPNIVLHICEADKLQILPCYFHLILWKGVILRKKDSSPHFPKRRNHFWGVESLQRLRTRHKFL